MSRLWRWLYTIPLRFRAIFTRSRVERDLADELAFHVERDIESQVARGLSADAARRSAHIALGGVEQQKERCRDARRTRLLEDTLRDVRYGLRLIRRHPGFSAVVMLSLAVAAGTATLVFGVADALFLRTLPVNRPDRLVSSHGGSYVFLQKLRPLHGVLADVAGICLLDRFDVRTGASIASVDPAPVRVALVTGNYLPLLGVQARIGRTLTPDDDRVAGAHPVAVISDRFWRTRFGAEQRALGGTFSLYGTTYGIVGVMPPGFTGDTVGRPIDIWIPAMMQSQVMPEMPGLLTRTAGWLRMVGRLQPGVSLEQARAAMQTVYTADQLQAAGPAASPQLTESIRRDRFELVSIATGYSRDRDTRMASVAILAALVALLLVIVCANVANLLLARAAARQREMTIRLAIGGAESRIFRQLLAESIVMSVLAGAIGLLWAAWAADAMSTTLMFGPTQLDPRAPSAWTSFDLHLGPAAFLFSLALCVAAGVLFGVAPAIRAARAPALMTPPPSVVGAGKSRFADVLIVAQIALSLMLVVDATLLVRSVRNLKAVDLGVNRDRLLLVWTNPGQAVPADRLPELSRRLRDRLTALPGVVAAGASNHGLLEGNEGGGSSDLIQVDGRPAAQGLQVYRDAVTPGFFAASGTPILAGREFNDRDTASMPHVIVINRTLARFLFRDGEAVGRRIGLPTDPAPVEIVGVVNDVRHGTPRDARGVWYVAGAQYPGLMRSMCIVLRTAGPPAATSALVRAELKALEPALPILSIDTMSEQLDEVLVQERIVAASATILGGLAIAVAALGLYGVVWYSLTRRTKEIGLKIALGATRAAILRNAAGGVFLRVALGVALGAPFAVACARLMSSRLYGIGAADPASIAAGAGAVSLIAAIAALIPARRASRIDPIVALREET